MGGGGGSGGGELREGAITVLTYQHGRLVRLEQ